MSDVEQGSSIRVDPEVHKRIKKLAVTEGRTIKVIVQRAVELYAKSKR